MKSYLLKVLDFTIIYIITDLFFSNLVFFKNGKIFDFGIDGITIMLIGTSFLYSFLILGIIKLISIKVDSFIYNSNSMICYIAFVFKSVEWFYTLFFGWVVSRTFSLSNILLNQLIVISNLVLTIFLLYYCWKYRIEISGGIFLGELLFEKILHRISPIFGMIIRDDWRQGVLISIIVILFISITIFLRKLGIYDFRSRKDKWQEANLEGAYKRFRKKELESR